MATNIYKASCVCRNMVFVFKTSVLPGKWSVRVCNCSFCSTRTGHIHCADPSGNVYFEFLDRRKVCLYRHGTNTADFLVCIGCGAYLGAVSFINKSWMAVLNMQHLVETIQLPEPYLVAWKGEGVRERILRRSKTWTPVCDWSHYAEFSTETIYY